MPINFPNSLDSLSNPAGTDRLNTPNHADQHGNANDAIEAIEQKLGIDSSADTSSIDYLVKNTNPNNVTFSHADGINTNTVSERTAAAGVTVDGLNIKDGKLNTNNSVVTANITDDAVTPPKLALGPDTASVDAEQSTGNTVYDNLATVGPTVTYEAAVTTTLLVMWGARISNSNLGFSSFVSIDISGATTTAAADAAAIYHRSSGSAGQLVISSTRAKLFTVNAGTNTIKLMYKVDGGTGNFDNRWLVVIPIG